MIVPVHLLRILRYRQKLSHFYWNSAIAVNTCCGICALYETCNRHGACHRASSALVAGGEEGCCLPLTSPARTTVHRVLGRVLIALQERHNRDCAKRCGGFHFRIVMTTPTIRTWCSSTPSKIAHTSGNDARSKVI